MVDIASALAILPSRQRWPLHGTAASRTVEAAWLAATPPFELMRRAGLGVARLALAAAPHAHTVWIACGPGNNGGDGLVAARHLLAAGRRVRVSFVGEATRLPPDAARAFNEAREAGVPIESGIAASPSADLAIDALLGLGSARAPAGAIAQGVAALNALGCPVIAVDLPTGLDTDRGTLRGEIAVRAAHTLALLTLKPGLFTAAGRDHAGQVWLDTLGIDPDTDCAGAWLSGPPPRRRRAHAQHKGSFGDVVVIGGAPGMGGAAQLAAAAALAAGAGRVLLGRLDDAPYALDPLHPELMPRPAAQCGEPDRLAAATVVCGCGGGTPVAALMPAVIAHARTLVLDADGLNALAADRTLAAALAERAVRGQPSVITPHPLEAARLLATSAAAVQADRIGAASTLAERFGCSVVLKGSGTVVASPLRQPLINPTGNARLAVAGAGDVLAGWMGGWIAAGAPMNPQAVHDAAAEAVWLHGRAAEIAAPEQPLAAGALAALMVRAASMPPAS